jgi:hypothetical protein
MQYACCLQRMQSSSLLPSLPCLPPSLSPLPPSFPLSPASLPVLHAAHAIHGLRRRGQRTCGGLRRAEAGRVKEPLEGTLVVIRWCVRQAHVERVKEQRKEELQRLKNVKKKVHAHAHTHAHTHTGAVRAAPRKRQEEGPARGPSESSRAFAPSRYRVDQYAVRSSESSRVRTRVRVRTSAGTRCTEYGARWTCTGEYEARLYRLSCTGEYEACTGEYEARLYRLSCTSEYEACTGEYEARLYRLSCTGEYEACTGEYEARLYRLSCTGEYEACTGEYGARWSCTGECGAPVSTLLPASVCLGFFLLRPARPRCPSRRTGCAPGGPARCLAGT